MRIINPATEEIITEVKEDTQEMLAQKFELLRSHQPEWAEMPLTERVGVVLEFSHLLDKNLEQLAATLTSEVGKPLQQSRNEINGARKRIKWLAENAENYLSPETITFEEGMEER